MQRLICLCLLGLALRLPAEMKESYAPIVGYNPNQGLILGAAAFLKSESDYTDIEGMGTLDNVYAAVLNYRHDFNESVRFEIDNDFNSFFDLYFGEGMRTRLEDKLRLDQLRYLGQLHLPVKIGANTALGPVAYERVRAEQGVDGDPKKRLISGEDTAAFGLELAMDGRDNEFSPLKGAFLNARVLNHPTPAGTNDAFTQAELDLRGFHSLGPVTFAGRLLGAWSWGDPSYLYRYQLGGDGVLRGYYGNRFRGKNKAAAQFEVRFPLYHFLSGDIFGDTGEVSDAGFQGRLRTGWGGGIRIALPPSGMMKARIDYGHGDDQDGIYVAFGHAF